MRRGMAARPCLAGARDAKLAAIPRSGPHHAPRRRSRPRLHALPAARRAARASGPLAGLTFAVKDIFDVAGYPTGGGQPHRARQAPAQDAHAPVVQALLDAGARFVGKTHTDELAFSMNGQNSHFGTPVNAAAPGRMPGGSSSGSAAAVAGGLCDFAPRLGHRRLGARRRRAIAASSASARRMGASAARGAATLAPSFDTPGWFTRDRRPFVRVGAGVPRRRTRRRSRRSRASSTATTPSAIARRGAGAARSPPS